MDTFCVVFATLGIDPEWVPEWLRKSALGLKHWQWLGLLLFALVGVILDNVVRLVIRGSVSLAVKRKGVDLDHDVVRKSVRPFGLLVMGLFWFLAVPLLRLPPPTSCGLSNWPSDLSALRPASGEPTGLLIFSAPSWSRAPGRPSPSLTISLSH